MVICSSFVRTDNHQMVAHRAFGVVRSPTFGPSTLRHTAQDECRVDGAGDRVGERVEVGAIRDEQW
jgi:hypothetical protein